MGVNDRELQRAGLTILDSPPGGPNQRRVFVGRANDGVAQVALSDAQGRKRLVMTVRPDGQSSLQFLDADGKVTQELPAPATAH